MEIYENINKTQQLGILSVLELKNSEDFKKIREIIPLNKEQGIDTLVVSRFLGAVFINSEYIVIDQKNDFIDISFENAKKRGYSVIIYKDLKFNIINKTLEEFKDETKDENKFLIHFDGGPYVESMCNFKKDFKVQFIDKDKNEIVYEAFIDNKNWCKANASFYINWNIKIEDLNTGDVIVDYDLDLSGKKVLISLDSKSLGDTIAWIEGVEAFRKKWNCELYLSTFHNYLFQESYKDIIFVNPGDTIEEIYAGYTIGWYYSDDNNFNRFRNKTDPKKIPLHATSYDILGCDFIETKPNISIKEKEVTKIKGIDKFVCISIHSSSQTKYWNNPNGWQELVDFFNYKNIKVINISKEKDGFMGNYLPSGVIDLSGMDLEEVTYCLNRSMMYIGVSSGLAWLSWSLGVKTVIISGFSDTYTEPTQNVIRIINKSVCNSCFNREKLRPDDWNWCPDNKNTTDQFICSKSISSNMVIDAISHLVEDVKNEKNQNVIDLNFIESDILNDIIKYRKYKKFKLITKNSDVGESIVSDNYKDKYDVIFIDNKHATNYKIHKNKLEPNGIFVFKDLKNDSFLTNETKTKIETNNEILIIV